jgi:hypothetical protein
VQKINLSLFLLLELPNSLIQIKFSTGKHDLENGCDDWSQCHWGTMGHEIRLKTLAPEHNTALSYRNYINGIDPSMERIAYLQ